MLGREAQSTQHRYFEFFLLLVENKWFATFRRRGAGRGTGLFRSARIPFARLVGPDRGGDDQNKEYRHRGQQNFSRTGIPAIVRGRHCDLSWFPSAPTLHAANSSE